MNSIRNLENRIRDAFSVVKNEIIVLKESFNSQKDKNSSFEKKIEVLDNRISSIKEDIEELRRERDYEEINEVKKEIDNVKKELKEISKEIKKKGKKEEAERIEEEIEEEEKSSYLKTIFWILILALIMVVSLGLYYDWYGVFDAGSQVSEDGFFRVLHVKEGDLVKLDTIATDKDKDNLFISYSGPLNSKGEWQTKAGDKGDYGVTVTVSDGKETISKMVKIVVE